MPISDAFGLLWRATPPVRLIEAALVILTLAGAAAPARAQVVGQSINMVTGTKWPTGDPFLERQNEPSMAVSSRNPLHLVAGNNDYRTVDLPGIDSDEPTGDAWLGFFTSMDGGNVWQSTLIPGYPQDTSANGIASPLKSFNAGADPTIRSGTNGLFYYSGLAFNRAANGTSAVFMARYVDDNNVQGANTVRYLGTSIVATGDSTHFLDKPFIAVDIPRSGSGTCKIPASADGSVPAATIAGGRIYIAYTEFVGNESSNQSSIMFSSSSDCGVTWAPPQKASGSAQTNQGAALAIDPSTGNVYIAWRIFKDTKYPDEIAGVALQYGSNTLTQIVQAPISPFDQGTTNVSFRTNGYPSMAVDAAGRLYVAWSQRGSTSNQATGGDARIYLIAGAPSYSAGTHIKGMQFSGPVMVDPYNGRGHQMMPALAFSSGKLTVAWYDFRNDDEITVYTADGGGTYSVAEELPQGVVPQFTYYVKDPSSPYSSSVWRQTVDVRAAQALPGLPPKFNPSVSVSEYAFGSPAFDPSTTANLPNDPENIQQLEFNAPNLPIFQVGTVPFLGDYIDVAGPTFVPYMSGQTELWRFNNLAGDPDHTHVVWTDDRNVVQPADGNWANYTPVASTGGTSLFDPSQTSPACIAGQTGMRNQDIYTATLSPGVIMGSKGSFKQLSTSLRRAFPVTVENPTNQTLYYRLTIQSQPSGGSASFLQYPVNGIPNPLTQLTIGIPPFSSASRSVFIQSSDATATVPLSAVQTDVNNNVIPNGLSSNVALNSDTSNPNISNPNISNIEIYNPNISNPNISNPNISNPNISNPNISNPNISNVAFANPNISNPNISNPNISNPNISNPNISNPNISNTAISGEITDVSYSVTNSGNTAVSYAVNLLQYQPPPQSVTVQLILSGVYLTPVANACTLSVQAHYTPIANITNPTFLTVGATLPSGPPPALAPTFSLQPGEQALITLRVYDPNASTPAQALQDYNPVTNIAPVIGSQAINTNLPPPPPTGLSVLAITTSTLPSIVANGTYSVQLAASGGSGSYTWSAPAGSLPPNLTLSAAGLLSGSPTTAGTYDVAVQVADSSGQTAQRSIILVVTPTPSITIATASLPTGQFDAPYSSTLAATGGTPPYRWSVAQGGVLPAGMGLNASSGTISGAPAQAGVWNVSIAVTDSANAYGTATIPLTIGLATAYAGGSNCYMPYPATPLYPSAASWTITTSSLPNPGQMSLLQGNVLSGCLSGGTGLNPVATGDYPIGFQAVTGAGTTSFTLPLHVVGQDQFSNGTYFADSGGVGNLPPSGYQQGVVTPGQGLTYAPGFWGANASNFSGSFLFGFGGGTVQSCLSGTTTSGAISLTTPSQPGRYDILFDGTTQGCESGLAFPSSPAPLIIDSVDAVSTTVIVANATVTGVSVTSTASNVQTRVVPNVLDIGAQTSGTTIPITVALNYSLYQESYCPGCIDQVEVGLNTDPGPQTCAYNGGTPSSGSGSVNLNVPNTPGRYYIAIDRGQDFSCKQTSQAWWNGPPSASRYIAVIDVW
jgi:Putative Ig domain